MAASDELSERMTELEVRVAYQDRIITALDDVVRGFAVRVETLERELAELRAANKSPAPPIGPASEKPPHY
jgi:uncharacterized coiled-coil protein SlyX